MAYIGYEFLVFYSLLIYNKGYTFCTEDGAGHRYRNTYLQMYLQMYLQFVFQIKSEFMW